MSPPLASPRRGTGRGCALGVAVSAVVIGGCGRHATIAECAALLDRYVELLVREQDPKADDAEIGRQKSATREKAARDTSFASCPKEVTAKAARCAMDAPNVDEFEKCLE
jgi:hypothetical protein